MTEHQQYQQGPILEGPVSPAPMPTQATPMPPQQHYNPMHKDPGESLAIAALWYRFLASVSLVSYRG